MIVLEERKLNLLTGRNEVRVTLIDSDGARREREHAMRIYSSAELKHIVTKAGMTIERAYGTLDGRDLTLDRNRLVLLVRR